MNILTIAGSLDVVSLEGIVEGWCWSSLMPQQAREVAVFVDGSPVGTVLADRYREDLKTAEIGDGHHAFRYVLPWSIIGQKRAISVSIRDSISGEMIGEPYVLLQRSTATLDERLSDMERQVRLLQSRVEEIGQRAEGSANSGGTALFRAVGRFFEDLANDLEQGAPLQSSSRFGEIVNAMEEIETDVALTTPKDPTAIMVIEASGNLTSIVDCMRHLQDVQVDKICDIVLVDLGKFEYVVVAPALVRGLRYRVSRSASALDVLDGLIDGSEPDWLIYMSSNCRPDRGWVEVAIRAACDGKDVAAVCGCVIRPDGIIHHAGLLRSPDGYWQDYGAGRVDDDWECSFAQPIDAAGAHVAAFRTEALRNIAGFQTGALLPGAAVAALCGRLGQSGWSTIYTPLARSGWLDTGQNDSRWVASGVESSFDVMGFPSSSPLNEVSRTERPRRGYACVVPNPLDLAPEALSSLSDIRELQHQGFLVVWLHIYAAGGEDESRQMLSRLGVGTLVSTQFTSTIEFIGKHSQEIEVIQFAELAPPNQNEMLQLVPHAKVRLSQDAAYKKAPPVHG